MAKYNDIDMGNWKNYEEINTDSLWIIEKRDNSGVHSGSYHGNFVPQIPRQLFSRYTKKGDWILDPFMGSGTSLIEAQRMGRNSIGIDIQKDLVKETFDRIAKEKNNSTKVKVANGDSREYNIKDLLSSLKINKVQFVILHPPYWDIIKFSNIKNDLSNSGTLENFLNSFGQVVDNTTSILEKNRYCSLIMGDKYSNGQVIPLGFMSMNVMLSKGFVLKGIIVKNFDETKGKNGNKAIWRYRALANDFYIFKHEYIFVFKKVK